VSIPFARRHRFGHLGVMNSLHFFLSFIGDYTA
jgi:hypothetical protein